MKMFDLIVLGILAFTTIRGAMKGIVWQLAAIAALVLCFVFAAPLSAIVAPVIGIEPPLGRWVAMLVIYLGFSFVCFAAARGLRGMIERMKFEEYDRHVGALFGFIKGAVFCLVLMFFLVTISESAGNAIRGTMSGRAAAVIMDRLHPVMSKGFHDAVEPYIHRLDGDGLDLQYGDHHHEVDDAGGVVPHGDHEHGPEQAAGPSEHETLLKIVEELTGGLDPELKELALGALENTAAEDRPELIEKLKSGVPGLIRLFSTEWQDGKPETARPIDEQLLNEISAVYSDYPQSQAAIREDIREALAGLPDEIVSRVISDWHADLMGLDPDPTPETGLTVSLDGRILKHLEVARVPLQSLEADLKNRLLQSLPR